MDPTPSIPGREGQAILSRELRDADAGKAAGSYAEYLRKEPIVPCKRNKPPVLWGHDETIIIAVEYTDLVTRERKGLHQRYTAETVDAMLCGPEILVQEINRLRDMLCKESQATPVDTRATTGDQQHRSEP